LEFDFRGPILNRGSSGHKEDMKYQFRSMNQSSRAFDVEQDNNFILRHCRFLRRHLIRRSLFPLNRFDDVLCFGRMPTMTARQPFRDRKLDDKKSIVAGSRSLSPVIQLTRKLPMVPFFCPDSPGASEPKNTSGEAQNDRDLPSFPGESWFGG
jgi:hypothetical protein